jgi:hypothetical protein
MRVPGGYAALLAPHSSESLPAVKLLPSRKGPKLATPNGFSKNF